MVEVHVLPLNLAVAFQVLDNIKNGQLRSCLAMGFMALEDQWFQRKKRRSQPYWQPARMRLVLPSL